MVLYFEYINMGEETGTAMAAAVKESVLQSMTRFFRDSNIANETSTGGQGEHGAAVVRLIMPCLSDMPCGPGTRLLQGIAGV